MGHLGGLKIKARSKLGLDAYLRLYREEIARLKPDEQAARLESLLQSDA